MLVHQALNVLRGSWSSARTVWLARDAGKVFSSGALGKLNSQCSVCRVVYLPIAIAAGLTLGEFVEKVVIGEVGFEGHVSVQEGSRLLYETEDFEDNAGKTLKELGIAQGTFVNVLDDDDPHYPVSFSISGCAYSILFTLKSYMLIPWSGCSILPSDSSDSYKLGAPVPSPIPTKLPPPVADPDSDDEAVLAAPKKRSADEAGLEDDGTAKKSKVDGVLTLNDEDEDIIVLD